MQNYNPDTFATLGLIYLIAWSVMGIGLAIGMGFLARRLGKSVVLWVILSLIPGYNIFFLYYAGFVVTLRVLRRLDEITERLGIAAPPAA